MSLSRYRLYFSGAAMAAELSASAVEFGASSLMCAHRPDAYAANVTVRWLRAGSIALAWLASVTLQCLTADGLEPPGKAAPARPRSIAVQEYIELEPLFSQSAKTLDPVEVARKGWQGYLTHMGAPEGMTGELKPMYRLYFDDRALPWASLKQNGVDGFDVNTRNVGAHAALHAMLGSEKDNDPVEAGQYAYILSLTPEGKGSFIRHGELGENLLDLYAQTHNESYREWAEKVITSLHPPIESSDPMGGWMHLHVGWNIGAFTKWYALTGDKEMLAAAMACADRVCKSRDPDGDDGAFRPDGSFGGKSQKTTASWHMHGHTHIMPELVTLGSQLLKDGQDAKGLELIAQARQMLDWLYDPRRNPDAGSLTGWLGEWLMCATGWDRKSDCEGCTMGDVVETAVALGAASRLHPSLIQQAEYYDQAEQFFRGQVVESIFEQRPTYLKVMRDCIAKRVGKNAIGSVAWQDQSSHKNHGELAVGDVTIRNITGGSKKAEAMRFNGQSYFKLHDSAALRAPKFAIATVLSAKGDQAQTVYANYDNPIKWGKGVNLAITPDRHVSFFTTDGTEANYDALISDKALSDGFHLVLATYDGAKKEIFIDGEPAGSAPCKGLDYGDKSIAAIGALREFEQRFVGDIAELLVIAQPDESSLAALTSYLRDKYSSASRTPGGKPPTSNVLLWVKADEGYIRERPEPTAKEREREIERQYTDSVETGKRLEGRLLGLSGFGDWVNSFPSTLDPSLPGIDMMGCCSDAVIRAAYAVWSEAVTGNKDETRVNLAFNRASSLVDVVSSLPHRGEINIMVKDAKKVLVRIPTWAPKEKVRCYVDKSPVQIEWHDSYVVFPAVAAGQQLTVTYPLRIAEIKETVGSLAGREFTEKWRGNTIVDISPAGLLIPMYLRPQLDSADLPQ
jgi:hypothetical protein